MNLQQLRFVREAVRQNFNLTEAAKALYTSQPGVSKAIIELEEELGVEIFRRHGKRIRGLTEPGRVILRSIETIMQEVDGLRRIGKEFAAQDAGSLTIATTHTLARYYLPRILPVFMQRFPKVRLSLLQGSPKQIVEMLLRDQADIAVATEAVEDTEGLITLPCYQWEHYVVVPPGHPLGKSKMITLEEISQYPLITYDSAFTGRAKLDQAFALRGLKPDILLEAIDADVIKTYVELGMGVGIIAGMAFDTERDKNLQPIPVGHLFGTSVSRLLIKRNMYLRSYVYAFTELLSPTLNRKMIEKAISGEGGNYEL